LGLELFGHQSRAYLTAQKYGNSAQYPKKIQKKFLDKDKL